MANAPEATLRRFQSPAARQSAALDELVRQAVFGAPEEREQARWLIWEIGQQAGVRPASIHELYLARGRGEVQPFTTPAMNIRVLSYDSARAVFRAAKRLDVGALICEIARSEIGYTEQRPAEYVAVITAAALREGFTGPLFIQGDHVQVNAKKYAVDAESELQAIRTLIEEELHAGFYNIDVDTSTLVDLSQATLDAQQRVNYERAADLTKFLRLPVPDELGQVGGPLVVDALLRVEGGLGEVDQRGGVDVDVVEAGVQLFFDQRPDRLQLALGVHGVLLGVHLHVIALDEQRSCEALAQRRGGHHGDVLSGALLGVADLGARDLADEGADVEALRGPEDGARGVVGEDTDVHRGRRERLDFPA